MMRRPFHLLLDYFCSAETHAVIWPELRIMMLKNAKTGTSTVSNSLIQGGELGPALTNRPGVPTLRYMQKLTPDDFNRFFIFTIVRNPFDRYVSFYGDRKDRGQSTGSIEQWTERFTLNYSYDRDFRDHARPQYISLLLKPDLVLRYENLEQDFQKLCTKLGVKHRALEPIRVGTSRKKENKTLQEWYASGMVSDFVREYYHLDFQKAGYDSGSI